MNQINLKDHYDVTIIGGGISGLTSAALFQRAGLSCCLLEMDSRPGGYLAGFRRHSYRFDSAIHWLNYCGEDGLVTKVFKIIGNDFPKCEQQHNIRRFVSDEFNYLVTDNPDELKEQWIEEFPHEKKGIIAFFKDAKKIAKSFEDYSNLSRHMSTMSWYQKPIHGLKMLRFVLPFIPHLKYTGSDGIKKGLNRYFKDKKLHRVFCSEPDVLSCLIPISWAYSKNFQLPPKGGSQSFPEWLVYATQKMDGDVFFRAKVTEVIVENKTAKGVKFNFKEKEYTVKSTYVVVASDAEALFDKLLPKDAVPLQNKAKLKKAPLYASAVTISLGLDCPAEELGLGEEVVYLANPNVDRDELGKGDPHKSGIHILASTIRDKSLSLPEHGTLTILVPAWMDENNTWGCDMDERGNYVRGDKYNQIKQEYADVLIDRVQNKLIPNLRSHIAYCDIATPVTHLRYTGNKNGTMMAQKPGKENYKAKVAEYKTPIKNLLQSGHWADLGGGVPIAVKSSINTTLMILQKERKDSFKLLAKYMDGKIDVDKLSSSTTLTPYDSSWVAKPTPAEKKLLRRDKEN